MINEFIENLIAWIVLLSNILFVSFIAIIIGARFSSKIKSMKEQILVILREDVLWLALAVSTTATMGSLFYSEIMGYSPCILCWYQRIFMYPQVVMFAVAIWRKDARVAYYSIALSIIGFAIALFHYIVQMGQLEIIACDTVGYSAKCTEMVFAHFGFITIPWMALSAFASLLILSSLLIFESRN